MGNVGMYSWAYTSLSTIDTKNLSFDMLKAVAKSEIDKSSEPAQFIINIPNVDSQQDFLNDLEERLVTLKSMQTVFSAQAKNLEIEAQSIN